MGVGEREARGEWMRSPERKLAKVYYISASPPTRHAIPSIFTAYHGVLRGRTAVRPQQCTGQLRNLLAFVSLSNPEPRIAARDRFRRSLIAELSPSSCRGRHSPGAPAEDSRSRHFLTRAAPKQPDAPPPRCTCECSCTWGVVGYIAVRGT